MKLTKVELNEGIKLSEVGDKEYIYRKRECGDIVSSGFKACFNLSGSSYYCIIRDNKVIPIIKDKEYDNEKPYLIGKTDSHIIGFIKCDSSIYSYNATETLHLNDDCDLNEFISFVNARGYNVYKQE